MIFRRNKRDAGFTMVEVLVAVCVLAIGAAALYTSIAYGLRCVAQAREDRRATQILLQATETIRLYTWEQLHDPNFLPLSMTYDYNPGTPGSSGVVYTNHVVVTPFPSALENYGTNLSQVTVALDWCNGSGPHHREITTFIARRGLQAYVY